ncbi:hypothetical protein [Streptomyces sp. NPDC059452]|uniref:hypothetical protein n=1 Tax=Streptomyces sp. NPDC059452 TaxID=3346835 RepID=UPI0036C8DEB8
MILAVVLAACLSSAHSPSREPDARSENASEGTSEHTKAELVERLLRHMEPGWRPEHTTLGPAGEGEFRVVARPGAGVTRLVVTCGGAGHVVIRQSAEASSPRADIRCGAEADSVARIELGPTESVTIAPSGSAVRILWGTRKVPA